MSLSSPPVHGPGQVVAELVMKGGIMEEGEARIRLQGVLVEHADLDAAITALSQQASPDQLQLMRLKKRKLQLKDRIEHLRDILNPDIIA
ncbi:YdcH family protein [Pacificimonas sp. ICDLI1SI03]